MAISDQVPAWFANRQFPLYLAPMAGFTDVIFRDLCRREGADVVVSEFVMEQALRKGGPRVWEQVDFTPGQRPMGVQIFGSDPAGMAEAARLVCDRLGPDFLDLNFGCPSPRVVACAAGSALLQDLPRLGRITAAVVAAVPSVPVTAKIRLGWDENSIVAPEAGHILESSGVRVLAVHGRTRAQEYRGEANWEAIGETAGRLKIPVIGNGSVRTAADVLRIKSTWPVRGVMIGRAALGYPWIFREIKAGLAAGHPTEPISLALRWRTMLDYAQALAARPTHYLRGPEMGWMRARLLPFTRSMPLCRWLRGEMSKIHNLAELLELSSRHQQEVSQTKFGDGLHQPDAD